MPYQGKNMKTLKTYLSLLALALAGTLIGCSRTATKSPDVSSQIRASLDQAGFKDVTVSQDRDNAVITLGGRVSADGDKS
jgi:hypothetical protein